MKVIFHEDFYQVYASDPAAAPGRMEAIMEVIRGRVEFVTCEKAPESSIAAVHSETHLERLRRGGLYDIACLAAGGAIQAATLGLEEPCFGLIRPPGHHASASSSWGFCYINNMAVSLEHLKGTGKISTAHVLDIDLHFGDGTVNILKGKDWVYVCNISSRSRDNYLAEVEDDLRGCEADIIGISAGFDNHEDDWGGTLKTEDYRTIGRMVLECASRNKGGCFALLEGGYNHSVLGHNVMALIQGLSGEG